MKLSAIFLMRKVVVEVPSDSWFRKQQMMQFAFLYHGRSSRCYRLGVNNVFKALQLMKKQRDVRKENTKQLWTERLSIASSQCGLPSVQALCEGIAQSNIALNRNMLQILAIYEPRTFSSLVDIVKQYHMERRVYVENMKPPQPVVSRGMLQSCIVPGNRKFYE